MGGQNVLPLPAMAAQPGMSGQGYGAQQGFDTTGQVAPPGMKPRVTATLWEDEGSLCFQVEAKGVCVARREGKKPYISLDSNTTNLNSQTIT
jgi:protein SOK2